MPTILTRIEGVLFLVLAVSIYWYGGFSWWLFVLSFFIADAFLLFYADSEKAGNITALKISTDRIVVLHVECFIITPSFEVQSAGA